ncbi:MAG: DUF2330 domain-containing protein [Polyangiaceae bacterium]
MASGVLVASAEQQADACGLFFVPKAKGLASLRVEQVLIIHDAAKEQEHFIRQISFREGDEHFGFVVPVPSKPTVAKVTGEPFKKLDDDFPMSGWNPNKPKAPVNNGPGIGLGGGFGSGAQVNVLSTEKIGSFTAFTLEATDGAAMKKWLSDNGLGSTAVSEAWLSHYTDLKFFFVALRFDPPAPAKAGAPAASPTVKPPAQANEPRPIRTESIRISFSTPLPFYPYLEPEHPDKGVVSQPRVLAVWLVSQTASQPVAAIKEGDEVHWKKPWREGQTNAPIAEGVLKATLGTELSALLPTAKEYVVQRFEDQKSVRTGWGDVVLLPSKPSKLDAAALEKRLKLMNVLDPALGGAK